MNAEAPGRDETDVDVPLTAEIALDRQLCFALYSASHAMTACYRPGLDALGLTYSQYVVMLVLWENGPTTMRVLSRRLHLDSGTLSPLLKRLEKQGTISRRRLPEDERSVEISTTPAGQELAERAGEVQLGVQRTLGMSADELGRLRRELTALADRLRTAGVEPDDAPGG